MSATPSPGPGTDSPASSAPPSAPPNTSAPGSPPPPAPGYAPPGYGQYPPPYPPRRSRTVIIAIVAVVIVVVIALAVLLLAGGVFKSSNNGAGGPQTFNQAASSVSSATNGYKGSSWKPILAAGIAPNVSISSNGSSFPTSSLGFGCNVQVLIANGTTFTLPKYTGSLGSGAATGWLFVLANSSALLVAIDLEGTVTPIALIGGGTGCVLSGITSLLTGLGGVVDSSTAAAAAWSAGGSAFVAAHPGATATFDVTSGESFLGVSRPAMWEVRYQACSPSAAGTSLNVPTFNASVNGATGQLVSSSTGMRPCASVANLGGTGTGGGSTPISAALVIGAAAEAQAGANYYYNFTIDSAGSGITWNDVNLQITNSGGTIVGAGITSYTVYNIAANTVCTSSGATETTWASGAAGSGASVITSSQKLVVVTTVNLAGTGAHLNALGVGSFSGTLLATIP